MECRIYRWSLGCRDRVKTAEVQPRVQRWGQECRDEVRV